MNNFTLHMQGVLRILFLLFMVLSDFCFGQDISIRTEYAFHAFELGPAYGVLEDVSVEDTGGVLYLFVDNLGVLSDSITQVELQDSSGVVSNPYGWYAWPGVMRAENQMFTGITIKGIEAPLTSGSYCKVIVTSALGAVDSIEISALSAPGLHLANIIPAQDGNSVFIYVRNDGGVDVEIDSIYFNTALFAADDVTVQFSGVNLIKPGEIQIIRLYGDVTYIEPSLAALRIVYHNLPSMVKQYTAAAVRCVHPQFHLGSWHSSGFEWANEYGRKRLRTLGVEMLQGPGNYFEMSDGFNRYHMQTLIEPYFGDPFDATIGIPFIQQLADSAMIAAWSVDDEPDLNGKDIDEQIEKALTYMRYDTNTAVYINLAVQHKFQRYGFYADIVGMDHYAAPSAPNIIPLTWIPVIGRTGEAREAYEYMMYLKRNTEPRRNWSWVQFAAGTWDVQPEPEAVNYQFWAQIMAGSKGLEMFTATSETQDIFPEQWSEGIRLMKEFKQIRNVALYGEPFGFVSPSHTQVLAGSLTGPKSMTVIAVNNSLTFSGDILSGFTTSWSEIPYSIDVYVPDWIARDDIYMVTEIGKSYDITFEEIATNIVRITPATPLNNRSHTFYIGPQDTTPPEKLSGLLVAYYADSANYTLSWKEPFDNVGVQGYRIYYNHVLVAQVTGLVYDVVDQSLNCSAYWKVEPYDNSGNVGEGDSLFFYLSGPELEILAEPIDVEVVAGASCTFTVVPNSVVHYQWQYYFDGAWVDMAESLDAIGTQSPHLDLYHVEEPTTVRCVLTSPCSGVLISEEAQVVLLENGIVSRDVNHLQVTPNPSSGIFTLRSDAAFDEIVIADMYGRTIMQIMQTGQALQVDLSAYAKGLYYAVVRTSAGYSTIKLLCL